MKRIAVYSIIGVLAFSTFTSGSMELGQNLIGFYANGGGSSGGNPYKVGVNFATTDNPWKPQILEDLAPFTCIRFMDWASQGDRNNQTKDWMRRTQKTDADQTCPWAAEFGPAFEWWVDLSNRTACDMWINIPCHALDHTISNSLPDFALRLAILIKVGVDMKTVDLSSMLDNLSTMTSDDFVAAGGTKTSNGLDENLHVYTEWANEVWNYYWDYAEAEGGAIGLGPSQFTGLADLRVKQAFDKVFGHNSERIRGTLAGQSDNAWHVSQQLSVVQDTKWNTDGTKMWGAAIAPYFNGQMSNISSQVGGIDAHLAAIQGSGLKLIGYEGGQSLYGGGCTAMIRDPAIYDVYRAYLAMLSSKFTGVFCHYGYAGDPSEQWGCWGSKEYVDQPSSEAHEFRALYEWAVANNPKVQVRKYHSAVIPETRNNFDITQKDGNFLITSRLSQSCTATVLNLNGKVLQKVSVSGNGRAKIPVLTIGGGMNILKITGHGIDKIQKITIIK